MIEWNVYVSGRYVGTVKATSSEDSARLAALSTFTPTEDDDVVVSNFADGEILELDNDGTIIQWDGEHGERYNCGETPEQFGIENFTEIEKQRCNWVEPTLAPKHDASAPVPKH